MRLITFLIFILSSATVNANGNYNKAYIKSLLIENAQKSEYVSPALAIAVAKVESNFRSDAVSHKGAVGVMQIMPRTALLEFGVERKKLFKPQINIKLGVKFLDSLIKKYRGDIGVALSHYNGGSSVGKWPNLKIIPATFPYVLKVLKTSKKLQKRVPSLSIIKAKTTTKTKNKFNNHYKKQKTSEIDLLVNNIDKWLNVYNNYKNKINIAHKSKISSNKKQYLYQGGGTNYQAFF